MTRDQVTLMHILQWVLYVTAVCATSFPMLYMFCPWWNSPLGRILMLHGFALALALDVTVAFQIWEPSDLLVYFWVQIAIFSMIAVANVLMTFWIWHLNFAPRRTHGTRPLDQ